MKQVFPRSGLFWQNVANDCRSEISSGQEHIMKTLYARFVKDQSGVTAMEYGLIAGLIAVP